MTDLILLRDFQASQIEFWLPTEYPGYDVSNFGRVRSWLKLHSLGVGNGTESFIGTTPRYLKPIPQSGGYIAVAPARDKNGRPKAISLHRLVARHFVPEVIGLPHVNHLNCVKTDCRSDNLEWTVPKRNTRHAIDAGVIRVMGEENPMATLSEAKVRGIKMLLHLGMASRAIADFMAIPYTQVRSIATGKTWKHVVLDIVQTN